MNYPTKITAAFAIAACVFMVSSCAPSAGNKKSKLANKNESGATGWTINDKKNGGFFLNTSYNSKDVKSGPGLVFIEGGTFTMGQTQEDVMLDWSNKPTQQHVRSFLLDEVEVTNAMYLEYLFWLKRVFPSEMEQYRHIYRGALPDTLVWRSPLGANETLVINYLRHPSYRNYPVVGVNWLQANKFCDWRSDRVNEKILIDKGILKEVNSSPDKIVEGENHFNTDTYLSDPSQVFKDRDDDVYGKGLPKLYTNPDEDQGNFKGRHVTIEDGILLPKYRLPTEVEWEYAAYGLVERTEKKTVKGRNIYPWQGTSPVSFHRMRRGEYLANYKGGVGDYSGISGWATDAADITAEVRSYAPNAFGLYDMAGNVAEWVADVYRAEVDQDNDFNYFRGNVFTKKVMDQDNKYVTVATDAIIYDTMPDGRLIPVQLPGEIKRAEVPQEETYTRTNYTRADNRSYGDGDVLSSRNFKAELSKEEQTPGAVAYNSPKTKITIDTKGNIVSEYDPSPRTTLVSDKSRVYKGGSWKDRLFWLSPSQRKYMPQDQATDFIGFRCAMDHTGANNPQKKTKS